GRTEVGAQIADAGRGVAIAVDGAGRADLGRLARRALVGPSHIADAGVEAVGVRAAGLVDLVGAAGRAEVGARIADAGVEAVGVRATGMVKVVGAAGGAPVPARDRRRRARARADGAVPLICMAHVAGGAVRQRHARDRRPALAVVVVVDEVVRVEIIEAGIDVRIGATA